MMDPQHYYQFWKILALYLEAMQQKHVRSLTGTGFVTRTERAPMPVKSAADR
jgi:predicted ATP-grasp superfamily ATP-dependent carboligase